MKTKYINIILALSLVVAGAMTPAAQVQAKDHPAVKWDVTYSKSTIGNKGSLTSTYNSNAEEILKAKESIKKVMPGDKITYEATCINASDSSADFYLTTDIVKSLEDGKDASGGAYTYELYYLPDGVTDKANATYIYNDELVGGDDTGLHQIKERKEDGLSDSEKTFFRVATITAGHNGKVVLEISLDGNSQDSSYMSALANINMEFGVEETPVPGIADRVINTSKTVRVVNKVPAGSEIVKINDPTMPLAGGGPATGDELIPVIACSLGLLLGILIIISYFAVERKQEREEVA